MKKIQGKRQLAQVIGRFEKPRVREIRILLYLQINKRISLSEAKKLETEVEDSAFCSPVSSQEL